MNKWTSVKQILQIAKRSHQNYQRNQANENANDLYMIYFYPYQQFQQRIYCIINDQRPVSLQPQHQKIDYLRSQTNAIKPIIIFLRRISHAINIFLFISMQVLHKHRPQIKISNIKFSVLQRRTKTSRYDSKMSVSNALITIGDRTQDLKRETMISRNSFIPTTTIKSQVQFEREKMVHHVPLHPLERTYSKFPPRKPKFYRPYKTHFSIFKEKLSSFSVKERSLISVPDLLPEEKDHISYSSKKRSITKSCLIFNGKQAERQPFIRYSKTNIKNQNKMERQNESKFQQTDSSHQ